MDSKSRTIKVPFTDEEWEKFNSFIKDNAYNKGAFIAKLIKEHVSEAEKE